MEPRERRRVGIVLAGGGARGAYEAGVLSVLLPELDRRGVRPTVFLGTSIGSVNACLFASLAHLQPEAAVAQALAVWRQLNRPAVFRNKHTVIVVDLYASRKGRECAFRRARGLCLSVGSSSRTRAVPYYDRAPPERRCERARYPINDRL